MTMRITAAGVTASNPIRYIKRFNPPVAGFESFLFTSDDLARALKNSVSLKADATAVGAPAVGVAGTFTDGNYIDTGVVETASMTLVAVVQRNAAQVMFMGTHSSADSNQVALYTNGASPRKPVFTARFAASAPVLVSAVDTWPTDPLAYEVVIGKVASTGASSLYLPRTGERITGTGTGGRSLSGRHIMIGAGPSPAASYTGDTTLGKAYGVATVAISNADEDVLYAWIKKRIAGV